MLRSAQPSQFSTYPSQYIDTPVLAVLQDSCVLKVSVPVHVLHHSVHAATDLSLCVALADEPRPLAVLPALVILRAAAAAEQRAHPRHVARVTCPWSRAQV